MSKIERLRRLGHRLSLRRWSRHQAARRSDAITWIWSGALLPHVGWLRQPMRSGRCWTFGRPGMLSRSRPSKLRLRDPTLGVIETDVAFGVVGVAPYLRLIERHQRRGPLRTRGEITAPPIHQNARQRLGTCRAVGSSIAHRALRVQPHEWRWSGNETGAPMENVVKAGVQFGTARRGGIGVVILEIIVMAPDQRASVLLCHAPVWRDRTSCQSALCQLIDDVPQPGRAGAYGPSPLR